MIICLLGPIYFLSFKKRGGVTSRRPVRAAKLIKNSNKYIEQLTFFRWKT